MDVALPPATSGGAPPETGTAAQPPANGSISPPPTNQPPAAKSPQSHTAALGLSLDPGLATILNQMPASLAVALKNMHQARLLQAQRADNGIAAGPVLAIKPLAGGQPAGVTSPTAPPSSPPNAAQPPIPLLAARTASGALAWPQAGTAADDAGGVALPDTEPAPTATSLLAALTSADPPASNPSALMPLLLPSTGRTDPAQPPAGAASAAASWTDAASVDFSRDFVSTLPSNMAAALTQDGANGYGSNGQGAYGQPDSGPPALSSFALQGSRPAQEASGAGAKDNAALCLALATTMSAGGAGEQSQAAGSVDSAGYLVGGPGSMAYPQRRYLDGYKAVSFVRTNELKQLFGPDARTRLPMHCTLRVELDGVMQQGVHCQVTFKETGAQNSVYYIKGFKAALALGKFHCGFRRLDAMTAVLLLRSVPPDDAALGHGGWNATRGRGGSGAGRGLKRDSGGPGFLDVGAAAKRGRRQSQSQQPPQRGFSGHLMEGEPAGTEGLWGAASMQPEHAGDAASPPCSETEEDDNNVCAREEGGFGGMSGVEGAGNGAGGSASQHEASWQHQVARAAVNASGVPQAQGGAQGLTQQLSAQRTASGAWGVPAAQRSSPGQLLSTLADVAAALHTKRLPPPAVPNPWLPSNRPPAGRPPTWAGSGAPPAVTSDLLPSHPPAQQPATKASTITSTAAQNPNEPPTNVGLAALAGYVHAGLINSAAPLPVLLLEGAATGATPPPADVRAALMGVLQALRQLGAPQPVMLAAHHAFNQLQGQALYRFCVETYTLLSVAHSSGQRSLVAHALAVGLGQEFADMLNALERPQQAQGQGGTVSEVPEAGGVGGGPEPIPEQVETLTQQLQEELGAACHTGPAASGEVFDVDTDGHTHATEVAAGEGGGSAVASALEGMVVKQEPQAALQATPDGLPLSM